MRTRTLMIFSLACLLIALVTPLPAKAHNPSSMTLEYDADTDTLTVTVSHSVSGDHRIAQIEVWKNEVSQEVRMYDPPQETTSGMDDTFTIDAVDGDVLKATATCSISGSITRELTVSIGTDTTTTDTSTTSDDTSETDTLPEPTDMNLIYVGVAAAGAVVIGLVICMRKR